MSGLRTVADTCTPFVQCCSEGHKWVVQCGGLFLSSFLQICIPYFIAFLYDRIVFLVALLLADTFQGFSGQDVLE